MTRPRSALDAALAVLLFVAAGVLAVRLVDRVLPARIGIGGKDRSALSRQTVEFLRGIGGQVTLTYFVSPRSAMPSPLKRLERDVRAILEAFERAAPDHVDARVVDPTLDPEAGPAYAARKRSAPLSLRTILGDEASQESIWSSLVIARDGSKDAHVHGIAPADLPYLEELIVRNLAAAASPMTPVVAVSSPKTGFSLLPRRIEAFASARVLSIDFDAEPRVPPEADVFFWVEPSRTTAVHRAEIERFLRSGRTAVVAGSAYAIDPVAPAGEGSPATYRARLAPCDWRTVLEPLGLEMRPLLLLDKSHDAIVWRRDDGSSVEVNAPFQMRVPAMQWDMRQLLGPPSGALLLSAASPIAIDPDRLRETGRSCSVIVTTSESARVMDLKASGEGEEGEFTDDAFAAAERVPKQPLVVLLSPDDPWRGQLLVASSASLFHDDLFERGGNANETFTRTLLRSFTEPSRLARTRVERPEPERIPPDLSSAARIAYRAFTIFFVPAAALILVVAAAWRRRTWAPRRRSVRFLAAAAAFPLVLAVLRLVPGGAAGGSAAALDLTRDAVNTPSPLTRSLLDRFGSGLEALCCMSDPIRVPASEKGVERRTVASLRALGIETRVVRPEDLPAAEREDLERAGIVPFSVERVEGDEAVLAPIYAGVLLRHGERSAAIPRIDARSVGHLEFLVAAAAKRIETGTAPRVGFLSDLPRLSPAEAHSDYQQKGYLAPIGSDVYSYAKDLLAGHGYDVAYVNPDAPEFPPDMDLLVWLQPRYPWRAYPQFVDYMASGGKAFVALQHYNVQQRQFAGRGFETVYWPQPQFHSFNDYLTHVGIRQIGDKVGNEPGEVLFDRSRGSLRIETQVNRSAFREHDAQEVARPFLIRAVGDSLSRSSVVTSRLGELLFIWGSRFEIDEKALEALGIEHEVLVSTSPATWSYKWSGGYIPGDAFEPPAEGLLGSQPLAVKLSGPFPRPAVTKSETGRDQLSAPPGPGDPSTKGELVLVGCSEMFKNEQLRSRGRNHDQLLLNAAAHLAHGPEMAEIQARQWEPERLEAQSPAARSSWRAVAIGLAPALLLLYAAVHRALRRRPVTTRKGNRS